MNLNPTAQSSTIHTYTNPIPDRQFILSLFGKMKEKLNREQIADALNLTNAEQKEGLRRRLRAMERDGQLTYSQRHGYQAIDQALLVDGIISIHSDGFGFLTYSDTEKDIFLPKNQLTHVFDGDHIQVLIESSNHKRSGSKLIKIIERKTTQIAGLLKRKDNDYILIPDNHKLPQKIQVEDCDILNASVGQYVNTKIINYPSYRRAAQVQIIEVLGHAKTVGLETKLALRRHGITEQWHKSILDKANSLGNDVAEKDKKSRVDYRSLPFVTIDGADAKDFDDAVYCERTESGDWRLLVAIADVSHYVKPNDDLDIEAQTRATSIYCPDQVIPMLPESLSNGLCSLKPNVDRLVLVCEMTINRAGIVSKSVFTEGVIHSHARLTYEQAHTMIVAKQNAQITNNLVGVDLNVATEQFTSIAPHITDLHSLSLDLIKARQKRGAIEFDTQELTYTLDTNNQIAQINPITRNDAHRMIEEFMLCANVATAQFLERHRIPGLFRIHEGPQQKKLIGLRALLAEKGLKLKGGDKPTTRHYNELLTKISQRSDADVIRTLLLRSQSQAEYSSNNQGHFGLAYAAYAHFTSPIRRYPDLITHRAIRAKIQSKTNSRIFKMVSYLSPAKFLNKTLDKKGYPYNEDAIKALSLHCSAQSRQADEISREVESALKCNYMEKFIGDSFVASISGVTSFGFFIELNHIGVEGLVPLSSFSQGEFVYNGEKQQLSNDQQHFSLGDKVQVVLKKVDLRQRKMDFELVA